MRGTIVIIGSGGREVDLLAARLEKEHYEVLRLKQTATVFGRAARLKPQAVLMTDSCKKSTVEGIVYVFRRFKTRVPVLLVTHDVLPAPLARSKGVGEVIALHTISLAEVVRRVRFAIALCQIAWIR